MWAGFYLHLLKRQLGCRFLVIQRVQLQYVAKKWHSLEFFKL